MFGQKAKEMVGSKNDVSSFRGARSASPESMTTIMTMDSGLRQEAHPGMTSWSTDHNQTNNQRKRHDRILLRLLQSLDLSRLPQHPAAGEGVRRRDRRGGRSWSAASSTPSTPASTPSARQPVPAKLAYQKKDMADWARSAGLAIKMPPTVFPVNSVKAMRGCIWLEPEGKHGAVRARRVRGLLGRRQGHLEGRGADRSLQARRRRSAEVLRRHRRAGDQGPAQGQHR